jgi:hypothetical protein
VLFYIDVKLVASLWTNIDGGCFGEKVPRKIFSFNRDDVRVESKKNQWSGTSQFVLLTKHQRKRQT